jgi:hypothetical protein
MFFALYFIAWTEFTGQDKDMTISSSSRYWPAGTGNNKKV